MDQTFQMKRQGLVEWIFYFKVLSKYMLYKQEVHFRSKNISMLNMKRQKKIFLENHNQKRAGKPIVISKSVNLKFVERNKGRHYILRKGLVHQEDKQL